MLTEHILYGMKLWALQLVPTLFPFMILTKLFLWFQEMYSEKSLNLSCFKKLRSSKKYSIMYLICKIWHLSPQGLTLLFLGLLCGYPVGAKMIGEQYNKHKITQKEADYLMTLCNQSSPAFILSYFISYALNRTEYALQILFLLYFSTYVTSLFTRHIYPSVIHFESDRTKNPTQNSSFFCYLDDCILSSASVCIKICGYIILFCIISALSIQFLHPFTPLNIYISSLFEITYGLTLLKDFPFSSLLLKELLLLGCFCFGGLCTMAQIKGMLVRTSLSLKPYFVGKCIYTVIVCFLYLSIQLCIKIF